jgi:hypothetical protein
VLCGNNEAVIFIACGKAAVSLVVVVVVVVVV